ncbi:MAG: hypothetical protein MNPFHGCM_01357 [Gemmatimonadaceae bacterium]|nr:hypothetical protein [Gemmatimonadaceae bacterium]
MHSAPSSTLEELLMQYLRLSAGATRACEYADTTALAGALDARELVTSALGRVPLGRDALPSATRQLAEQALTANRTLEALVISVRDDLRRQLERITHDMAAVSGYAGSAPRTSRVDERR